MLWTNAQEEVLAFTAKGNNLCILGRSGAFEHISYDIMTRTIKEVHRFVEIISVIELFY